MNWLHYFQRNRERRFVIPWGEELRLQPKLRVALARSLQRFQLGESGEGNHLKMHSRATGDSDYAATIDLFIAEEQEHARLMAVILEKLGVPLLKGHWSDHCFIFMRRLFGLHQELMVLLLPEMIARRYFRALHQGTANPALRAVFAQIAHDEDGHVAFHVDYLKNAFSGMSLPVRLTSRIVWRIVFRAVCVVVWCEHRTILKAVGLSAGAFWWDTGLIFDEVSAGIYSFAPGPFVAEPECDAV